MTNCRPHPECGCVGATGTSRSAWILPDRREVPNRVIIQPAAAGPLHPPQPRSATYRVRKYLHLGFVICPSSFCSPPDSVLIAPPSLPRTNSAILPSHPPPVPPFLLRWENS